MKTSLILIFLLFASIWGFSQTNYDSIRNDYMRKECKRKGHLWEKFSFQTGSGHNSGDSPFDFFEDGKDTVYVLHVTKIINLTCHRCYKDSIHWTYTRKLLYPVYSKLKSH